MIAKLTETRPKIKLPLSQLDKTLETGGKCMIMLLWVLAIIAFFKMPDTIPTHFNALGQTDNFGNKGTIFILPVIATIIFIGLTILNNYPHILNYINKITEANAVYQYTIATRMLRVLKLMIVILFTAIVLLTYLTAIHAIKGLSKSFLPFIICLFCMLPAIGTMLAYKKNQH